MTNHELNDAVATEVMGLTKHVEEKAYGYGPHDTEEVWRDKAGFKFHGADFATDIKAAWSVVERMKTDPFGIGPDFELLWGPEDEEGQENQWVVQFGSRYYLDGTPRPLGQFVEESASAAPRAICLAALKVARLTKS